MEHSTWFRIYDVVNGGDQLLRLVGQIVILLVLRGVVRRHRPDAWPAFRAWAAAAIVGSIIVPVGWRLVVSAASTGLDSTAPMKGMVLVTAVDFVFYVVLALLLVRAVVRIAQPPPSPVVPTTPPYR